MQLLKSPCVYSMIWLGLLLPITIVGAGQELQPRQSAHIQASGVVTQVSKTGITLKTPAASVTLNANATERSGLTHVKVGDELTIWINEDNIVVDVHKTGHQREHRLITGKVARTLEGSMVNEGDGLDSHFRSSCYCPVTRYTVSGKV